MYFLAQNAGWDVEGGERRSNGINCLLGRARKENRGGGKEREPHCVDGKSRRGGWWIVAGLPAQPTFVAIKQKKLFVRVLKAMHLGSICSQHDAKKC